jgi:DNA polymerase-3 subunit epsilon
LRQLGRWGYLCPFSLPVSVSQPESTSPWQQTDLLGLLSEGEPAAAPEPDAVAAALVTPVGEPAPVPVPTPTPAQASPVFPSSCPATLLILDTETTGLDPSQGQCIEVGAILFDVAARAVLSQVSFLLPAPANPAEHVNGIAAAVTRRPQPWQAGLTCFSALVASADAVLAHNAGFDRQWFGIAPLPAITLPWICSMDDIRWPADRHLRATPSVRDLALAYGVPVWAAHRALTDCTYLAQVLERCDDLEDLLAAALEPRRLFRAQLSYAERHRAREAGFRWNDPVPGAWSRRLSEREARALSFPVQPVEPLPLAA